MLKEIVHVGLTVANIDISIDFYEKVLGLSFQGRIGMEGMETDLLFKKKNCKVQVAYLNGSDVVSSPSIELIQFTSEDCIKSSSDLSKTSISEVCFRVDDIEKVYRDLSEKGVEFFSEPQFFDFSEQGFGKSKAVYFKDPDGIILELIQSVE